LIFGDFEVARREDGSLWELGRGAMGVTYLALDKVLRRKVALKVIEIPPAARSSQPVRERFLREARSAAALRHPNVAAVFQFGASPDGRRRYYAMCAGMVHLIPNLPWKLRSRSREHWRLLRPAV
jgi:serine/threonine protein kinase